MKIGKCLFRRGVIPLAIATVGMSFTLLAVAASDCWLDLYDQTDFKGAHVRLEGPQEWPNLSQLQGQDWANRIDSLVVGPAAQIYAYRQEGFKQDLSGLNYHGDAIKNWGEKAKNYSDSEISFAPGQKEHHLGELNFHHNINSLKIKCIR